MRELLEGVRLLVDQEYVRSSPDHGLSHHSYHESFAAILEEFQESQDEANKVNEAMSAFWQMVRMDDQRNMPIALDNIYYNAIKCAGELIQVASTAYRARARFGGDGNGNKAFY